MMEQDVLKIEVYSGVSFDMVYVEGGQFLMGSEDEDASEWEKPVHPVKLSPYYIGKFPVTQALWKAVMNGENPSYYKGENRPVETVSWEDAQLFIQKLKDVTGKNFRLPTEAEWEFAARGGNNSEGFLYAGSDKLKEVGWYNDNSRETKPVGLKFPNELGLFDMSGNVWEWCNDRYSHSEYYKECKIKGIIENPEGPEKGDYWVYRGGGYIAYSRYCRCSYRHNNSPEFRNDLIGFRFALSPKLVGKRTETCEQKRQLLNLKQYG